MISYVPNSLTDCAISEPASRLLLENIIDGSARFPISMNGILLAGVPGTGKTTLARQLPIWFEAANSLAQCKRPAGIHTLFQNSDFIYETACESVSTASLGVKDIRKRNGNEMYAGQSGWHYEILDEVDALSTAGQSNLKSMMTHCKYTIFILTCNNLQKLDRALIDRCLLINMNAASPEQLLTPARNLLRLAGCSESAVSDDLLLELGKGCRGSLRQLGQAAVLCASSAPQVSTEQAD